MHSLAVGQETKYVGGMFSRSVTYWHLFMNVVHDGIFYRTTGWYSFSKVKKRGYEGYNVDHADYINPLDSFAKTAYCLVNF